MHSELATSIRHKYISGSFFLFKKTLCMKRYILSNMINMSCLELSTQIICNSSEEEAFLSSQNSRLDEYK